MSERPDFKGDFMGFTYNNIHSSVLGIVRTSDGSRFNENLLPIIQDKTVQVPGGDGTYYFGSYYTQRPFTIPFAFDSLTEQQLERIKSHFGDKKIHDLIFDEIPYRVYSAKVTGTATIKHIAFEEGKTNRLYKGEGTIQFVCFQPYARCQYKWLDQYDDKNIEEWRDACRLIDRNASMVEYDKYVADSNLIRLYNAGDIDSHFQLKLNFVSGKIAAGQISINNMPERQIQWEEILIQSDNDAYVKINSRINLIEGYDSNGIKTGTVYNKHILAGDFFRIPKGESEMIVSANNKESYELEPIEYYYYYI